MPLEEGSCEWVTRCQCACADDRLAAFDHRAADDHGRWQTCGQQIAEQAQAFGDIRQPWRRWGAAGCRSSDQTGTAARLLAAPMQNRCPTIRVAHDRYSAVLIPKDQPGIQLADREGEHGVFIAGSALLLAVKDVNHGDTEVLRTARLATDGLADGTSTDEYRCLIMSEGHEVWCWDGRMLLLDDHITCGTYLLDHQQN